MDMIKHQKPPEEPPRFDATPDNLLEQARLLIHRTRATQDRLVSTVRPETATFGNTLLPLAEDNGHRLRGSSILEFYQHVSTDERLRTASREAQRLLNNFSIECTARTDVYHLVDAVYRRRESLDPESERLLISERRQFILNGQRIPSEEDRARFEEIKRLITHKSIEFRKNLSDSKESIWFTRQELQGVPEKLIDMFERGTGINADKFRVTIRHTHTLLNSASCGGTRKRILVADANGRSENVSLLKSAIVLRDEAARLLGYSSHAELRLEDSMQDSLETTTSFLTDLRSKLRKMGESEVQEMLRFKEKHVESRGEDFDGRFYLWDRWYYAERMKQQYFFVDDRKVNEYFPLGPTLSHMLEILEDLFGLKFNVIGTEVVQSAAGGDDTNFIWHKDVRAYSVWSQGNDHAQSSDLEFLGYLYLDLHPREGKNFRANCTFLLRPGFTDSSGKRWYPATALVCNFPASTETKPSLLSHDSIWVLFHELGHTVHDLVSKAQYARFHGANTVRDFGEAPSQMLEYWCWTASTLRRINQHYSTVSPECRETWQKEQAAQGEEKPPRTVPRQMPEDMLKNLIKTEKYNIALFHLSTLHISVFDLTVHGPASHEEVKHINTSHLWNSLAKEIVGIDGPESQGEGYDWGHPEGNLRHLLGDYDAGYYSYIVSKVYAADMFYSKFASDPMNAEEGRRYRRMVLEKGGSMDEMDMLTQYLGHRPRLDAFYEELGIGNSPES